MSYRTKIPIPSDFLRRDSVQPSPWLAVGDVWFLVIYGKFRNSGLDMQQHVWMWSPGKPAEHVDMPATLARGDIGVHATGAALFAWDKGADADHPELWVQGPIPGFTPAPLDSRVDALVAKVAELEQQIATIETALGGASGLSARYQAALDRLCALLEI